MTVLSTEEAHYESKLAELLASLGSVSGGSINPVRLSAINFIKAKLDELLPEGAGITFSLSAGTDVSNPWDLLIDSQLDEGVKDISLSAPISALKPTSWAGTATPFKAGDLTGYIVLPTNFLRLLSFRMFDWLRDATITTPGTSLGKNQSNKFLRGGITKPVGILNWKRVIVSPELTPSTHRVIEYYSVQNIHSIDKLFYIPQMVAEDFITDNPKLLDSLAWQVASKILQIIEKTDLAKMAQERVAQSYTNIEGV